MFNIGVVSLMPVMAARRRSVPGPGDETTWKFFESFWINVLCAKTCNSASSGNQPTHRTQEANEAFLVGDRGLGNQRDEGPDLRRGGHITEVGGHDPHDLHLLTLEGESPSDDLRIRSEAAFPVTVRQHCGQLPARHGLVAPQEPSERGLSPQNVEV